VRDTPRGFDKRQLCVRPGHTVLTITVFAIQADEFPMPISWTTVESQANSGGPALAHRSLKVMLQTVFVFMINCLRRVNKMKAEWEESIFYCIVLHDGFRLNLVLTSTSMLICYDLHLI